MGGEESAGVGGGDPRPAMIERFVHVSTMLRPLAVTTIALITAFAVAGPAAAGAATVDRIANVETFLVVAFGDDFPIASISRADCTFTQLVVRPDGSATETMHCRLNDNPVSVPEYQGSAPQVAFHNWGGPCEWVSDYWYAKNESIVFADSYRYVVTPGGLVFAQATYPAEPVACE